ncbi:LOW QUALITY PROTEIN: uncharacterized protein LOC120797756 [Xiphias gladius]|uniref:LOW QUALITY PROTEIN: uncharacterized protein LOC120797756 n=1 Tax=Xiphias gladius TaxID=8245 RepID=UPI001A980781|nr:LOW QUALITY PROTEIN: uncharacterized protein LOC120797756 [Xiphias gladius]
MLMMWVSLHDVEAFNSPTVIHKKVGDTVEFSPRSPTQGVTSASWKYNSEIVANKVSDKNEITEDAQFKDRLSINSSFSLTVTRLTLQDSGNFSFVSEVNDVQQKTIHFTLLVHETITSAVVNVSSDWHALNESCIVLLACNGSSESIVTYQWTVGNQTRNGSRMQYNLRPEDGEIEFNCTVFGFDSKMSQSKTVTCTPESIKTDVEAFNSPTVIHKKVGDPVEFSPRSRTQGVTSASWKYNSEIVANKVSDKTEITENAQFKDRLSINPTNFSLTITRLTLQDSGNFSFVSEVNDVQQKTIHFTLLVHETITSAVVNVSSDWNALNESCIVLLACNGSSESIVTYQWTVGNQTRNGSRMQYNLRPEDGEIEFNCTVFGFDSKMSQSKTVTCTPESEKTELQTLFLFLSVAAGGCLFVIVAIFIGVRHYKQRQAVNDSDDLTVYADISDLVNDDKIPNTMKPCSVYETIDNTVNTLTPGPQTVYDKIQFNRVRKAPVSR